jgi:Rad3-related DNA helicase
VDVQQATRIKWLPEAIDFLWESIMVKLDLVGKTGEIELEKWNIVPRFIDRVDIEQLLVTTRPPMEVEDQSVPTETPLDRLVDFLYTGLRAVESDDWHASLEARRRPGGELNLSEARLKIRPLNASGLTAPVLRGAQSALLMSGTLRPMEHYAKLLGVQGALMEAIGSPYPERSRLVLVDQSLSTRYKERTTSLWQEIAERIGIALETMPSNKSALVAFPSYATMECVLSHNVHCGDRLRLIETRDARIEDIKEAIESRPHAVFCVYGGKFSEGVDLAEGGSSLIDIIIGVGIPFSPPTSYTLALQDWYERRYESGAGFYYTEVLPSIRKVAQLIGRLRRSPSDWGVVLLLDKRFRKHIRVFGEDIVSDIWPYKTKEELREAIAQFIDWRTKY